MRRFKSVGHPQLFLSVHGPVRNLFGVGRHLLRAAHRCVEARKRAGLVKLTEPGRGADGSSVTGRGGLSLRRRGEQRAAPPCPRRGLTLGRVLST